MKINRGSFFAKNGLPKELETLLTALSDIQVMDCASGISRLVYRRRFRYIFALVCAAQASKQISVRPIFFMSFLFYNNEIIHFIHCI